VLGRKEGFTRREGANSVGNKAEGREKLTMGVRGYRERERRETREWKRGKMQEDTGNGTARRAIFVCPQFLPSFVSFRG
jgi:hypothetical protein